MTVVNPANQIARLIAMEQLICVLATYTTPHHKYFISGHFYPSEIAGRRY